MKGVLGIGEPLASSEEFTEVCNSLGFRLDDEILHRLDKIIGIGNGDARPAPRLTLHGEVLPSLRRRLRFLNRNRSGRFNPNGLHAFGIFEEEMSLDVHRQDVSGNANGYRTPIVSQRSFNMSYGVGQNKFKSVGLGRSGAQRKCRWHVPLMGAFPLIFGEGLSVDHPVVKAFKRDAARGWVVEYGNTVRAACVQNRVVGFKRSSAFRKHEQSGAMSVQPSDLQISRIVPNVGVIKRTVCMSLLESAIG